MVTARVSSISPPCLCYEARFSVASDAISIIQAGRQSCVVEVEQKCCHCRVSLNRSCASRLADWSPAGNHERPAKLEREPSRKNGEESASRHQNDLAEPVTVRARVASVSHLSVQDTVSEHRTHVTDILVMRFVHCMRQSLPHPSMYIVTFTAWINLFKSRDLVYIS